MKKIKKMVPRGPAANSANLQNYPAGRQIRNQFCADSGMQIELSWGPRRKIGIKMQICILILSIMKPRANLREVHSRKSGKIKPSANLQKVRKPAKPELKPSANLPNVRSQKRANLHTYKSRPFANWRKVQKSSLRKLLESLNLKLLFAVSVSSSARKEHPTRDARGSLMPGAGDETARRRQTNPFNLYPRRDNAFAELSALKEGVK